VDILAVLAAGGDMATLAIFYILWKTDRRLLTLELNHKQHIELHH